MPVWLSTLVLFRSCAKAVHKIRNMGILLHAVSFYKARHKTKRRFQNANKLTISHVLVEYTVLSPAAYHRRKGCPLTLTGRATQVTMLPIEKGAHTCDLLPILFALLLLSFSHGIRWARRLTSGICRAASAITAHPLNEYTWRLRTKTGRTISASSQIRNHLGRNKGQFFTTNESHFQKQVSGAPYEKARLTRVHFKWFATEGSEPLF